MSQREKVDEANNDKVCPPQSQNQALNSFKFFHEYFAIG